GETHTNPSLYVVILSGGDILYFDTAPVAHPRQAVTEVTTRGGGPVGIKVDGQLQQVHDPPAQTRDSGGRIFGAFVALGAVLLLPVMIWSRRLYRAVRADLKVPTVSERRTYVGSWIWRGIGSSSGFTGQRLNWTSGFPVAMSNDRGELEWFSAPLLH